MVGPEESDELEAPSSLAPPLDPALSNFTSFSFSLSSFSLSSSLVSLKLSLIYLVTFSITDKLIGELVVFDESNPPFLGAA